MFKSRAVLVSANLAALAGAVLIALAATPAAGTVFVADDGTGQIVPPPPPVTPNGNGWIG